MVPLMWPRSDSVKAVSPNQLCSSEKSLVQVMSAYDSYTRKEFLTAKAVEDQLQFLLRIA